MVDNDLKLPKPMGTLDELLEQGDSSATPYKVYVGHNLGNRTFVMLVPMHEFFSISEVANVQGRNGEPIAQRKLDINHAKKMALYILKGLVSAAIEKREIKKEIISEKFYELRDTLGRQPYLSLQPIVVNLRSCDPKGINIPAYRLLTKEEETAGFKIYLSQKDVLWVIDGQHRRKAMEMVFEFLNYLRLNHKYPGRNASLFPFGGDAEISAVELQVWEECYQVARTFCTVVVEVHLGLSIDEERQLFHDLNNLGKKVEASLALQFDNSNPVNLFIKDELIGNIINWDIVERDVVNWQDDTGAIARKDLVVVNARLFLNKNNISGATPPVVESAKQVAIRFWEAINEVPFLGEPGAKMKSCAAQPVMLKALAKLTYDFAFGRSKSEEHLDKLLSSIPILDYSHSNAMWRYYELTDSERIALGLEGLKNYLPADDEGYNRDIGGFDQKTGVMRFGAKSNDIFPILGDMIRFKLGLPSRHSGSEREELSH